MIDPLIGILSSIGAGAILGSRWELVERQVKRLARSKKIDAA